MYEVLYCYFHQKSACTHANMHTGPRIRDVCAEKLNIETAVVHGNGNVGVHKRRTQNGKHSMRIQGSDAARAKCERRPHSCVGTRAENSENSQNPVKVESLARVNARLNTCCTYEKGYLLGAIDRTIGARDRLKTFTLRTQRSRNSSQ
jgi:hypothetical protein